MLQRRRQWLPRSRGAQLGGFKLGGKRSRCQRGGELGLATTLSRAQGVDQAVFAGCGSEIKDAASSWSRRECPACRE